jgi:hypothetical protein
MSLGKAIVVSELVADSGRGAATSQDVLTQQVLGGEWCSTYFGHIMMTRSEILSVRPSNFCSHFMGRKCHIIEAIFFNFGPWSEFFDLLKWLPLEPDDIGPRVGPTEPPHAELTPHNLPSPSSNPDKKPNPSNEATHTQPPNHKHISEPIHTQPPTHKHIYLVPSSHQNTPAPVCPNSPLKRKSPPPPPPIVQIGELKKAKKEFPPSKPNQSLHEDSEGVLVPPSTCSISGVVAPFSLCFDTLVPKQNFPMAEEAGLIMPPPAP